MTAAARVRRAPDSPPAAKVDSITAFTARAQARAQLWFNGELSLHEAVDGLQAAAVRDGLVAAIGTDRVQAIMVEAFDPLRDDLPGFESDVGDIADAPFDGDTFAAACRAADERVRSRPRAPSNARPLVARSTLQAAEYLLSTRNPERLRAWLDQNTPDERAAILRYLEQRRKARAS